MLAAYPATTSEALGIAPQICQSLDLDVTLVVTCQYANERFKTRHSALALFNAERTCGTVLAESPPNFGAVGTRIPLVGVPREEQLIAAREPVAIEDVRKETGLGTIRQTLLDFGVTAILLVPIIGNDRVYGSFSIDIFDGPRDFTPQDITVAKEIADRVATAIATAEFFEGERRRAQQLDELRIMSLQINVERNRATLLNSIVANASDLFKARSAGLYEYDEESGVLTLVAEHNGTHRLKQIHRKEGMAGRLIDSSDPFMIIPDYDHWAGIAPTYKDDPTPFGAVMGVPLKWNGEARKGYFTLTTRPAADSHQRTPDSWDYMQTKRRQHW